MRRAVLLFASAAFAVVLCFITTPGSPTMAQQGGRPNIIFILTDDLDAHPKSISRMPNLRRYLINQGTTFENAFVTTSICCPSRATFLRGQYSHNHGIRTNTAPLGGGQRFRRLGRDRSTVATWLHGAGYRTALIGKYLNQYKGPIPPGWDTWVDKRVPDGAYHTDYYARKAANFIRNTKGKSKPFFMWLGTQAPHDPANPPPRYSDRFPSVRAPHPPSFNEQNVSDKPRWIREKNLLTPTEIQGIDKLYRNRLRSMLAVDDLVGKLVRSLRYSRKFSNTYIVFTSDNGRTMGLHRRGEGKWSAYEEDMRVPLIVRGPGVSKGVERKHMVLNNDLAPTFAKLGRVSAPSFVDGRPIVPLLHRGPTSPSNWRSAFLEEAVEAPQSPIKRPAFKAVRTTNYLWVEYVNGERELYNLKQDPYELQSVHQTASLALKQRLSSKLERLRDCSRQGCRNSEGF